MFGIIAWILLLGLGVSWLVFDISDWYLLLPVAYILFSISDGSISKLEIIKRMSLLQIIVILFAFIASVGIVFGLIQLANYLINEVLHLTGWPKTISQFIAVILSLYPIKFTFGSIVYKIVSDVNDKNKV